VRFSESRHVFIQEVSCAAFPISGHTNCAAGTYCNIPVSLMQRGDTFQVETECENPVLSHCCKKPVSGAVLQECKIMQLALNRWEHAVEKWFRHYVTSRKVAGSRLDKVMIFIDLPNPSAALCPWVYSGCNRNEYQKKK
jgi:hypothetical protein